MLAWLSSLNSKCYTLRGLRSGSLRDTSKTWAAFVLSSHRTTLRAAEIKQSAALCTAGELRCLLKYVRFFSCGSSQKHLGSNKILAPNVFAATTCFMQYNDRNSEYDQNADVQDGRICVLNFIGIGVIRNFQYLIVAVFFFKKIFYQLIRIMWIEHKIVFFQNWLLSANFLYSNANFKSSYHAI